METLTKLLQSVQKYVKNKFLRLNSLIFSKFSSKNRIRMFVHYIGPNLCKCENYERTELSWANNVSNNKFSVGASLEHGSAIENTYFQ